MASASFRNGCGNWNPTESGEGTPWPPTLATLRGREVFSNELAQGSVIWGATTEVAPGPAGVWVGDTGNSYIELRREPNQVSAIVRWSDVSDPLLRMPTWMPEQAAGGGRAFGAATDPGPALHGIPDSGHEAATVTPSR
jgi:hypothetical protein